MNNREKLDLMDKILRQLDDLRNSQTSVVKKVAQIEVDNIELGNKLLEEKIPDVFAEMDDAVEKMDALFQEFTEVRDKFSKDNKLEEPDSAG